MHPISLRKAGIHNDRKYKIHDYSLEHITGSVSGDGSLTQKIFKGIRQGDVSLVLFV